MSSRLVAVMMEYSDDISLDHYMGLSANQFYDTVIVPAVTAAGGQNERIICRRADSRDEGDFVRVICSLLMYSDVAIFELSSKSLNVMYELGIRHAIGGPSLLMVSNAAILPANVNHQQAIIYGGPQNRGLVKDGEQGAISDRKAQKSSLNTRISAIRTRITKAVRLCLQGDSAYLESPVSQFITPPSGADPPWASRLRLIGILNEVEHRDRYPLDALVTRSTWLDHGSKVLVVGRSNIQWANWLVRMGERVRFSNAKFTFLLADSSADASILLPSERVQLSRDIRIATEVFLEFQSRFPEMIEVGFLPWLPLDSMSFYEPVRGGAALVHVDLKMTRGDREDFDPARKSRVVIEVSRRTQGSAEEQETSWSHGIYDVFRASADSLYNKARKHMDDAAIGQNIRIRLVEHTPSGAALERQRRNEPINFIARTAVIFESAQSRIQVPPPICVQVEVTGHCGSARCKICLRWADPDSRILELSRDDIANLLGQLADSGVKSVVFSGGEPLNRTDIADILDDARKYGLAVGLISDGTQLSERKSEALAGAASWVAISLDAPNSEVYKIVRGWDGFERATSGLEHLAAASARLGTNPTVSVSMTVSRLNIDYVSEMLEWFRDNRNLAQWLRIKFAHGQADWQKRHIADSSQIQALSGYLSKLVEDQSPLIDGTNIEYLVRNFLRELPFEDIASGSPIKDPVFRPADPINRCFTPYVFALIDPQGGVYPCCYLYYDNHSLNTARDGRPSFNMGNIQDRSFMEIWRGDKFEKLRTVSDPRTASLCAECTRHYQHNRTLNNLSEFYESLDLSSRETYKKVAQHMQQGTPGDIWF